MTTESTSNNATGGPGDAASGAGAYYGTAAGHDAGRYPFPLYRPQDGRILGGVAAGLARYLDLDVSIVRIAVVVLALLGGTGIPLYVAGWLLIPDEGTGHSVLADLLHPHAAL